jgi:hypothetical protein
MKGQTDLFSILKLDLDDPFNNFCRDDFVDGFEDGGVEPSVFVVPPVLDGCCGG